MKTAIASMLLLATMAAAAAIVAPIAISARLTETAIAERLSSWTGGQVSLQGQAEVTLLPWPTIAVTEVVIPGRRGAKDPPLATIASLEASLQLLPLLAGQLKPRTLTLVEPHIHLVADGNEAEDSKAGAFRSNAALENLLSGAGAFRPGEVVIRNGAVSYHSRGTERTEEIAAAELHVAWQDPRHPAAISGSFEWNRKLVEFDAVLDRPQAVVSDSGSNLHLTLRAEPAQDLMEDHRGIRGAIREGDHAPLRFYDVLRWATAAAAIDPFEVTGTVRAGENEYSLSDATLASGDVSAEFGFAVRLDGRRPLVRASVAFDELRLGRHLRAAIPKDLARLRALPVSADWLDDADADLRISATKIGLGGLEIGKTALNATVREGRMTLRLEETALAGGRANGQFTVEPAGNGALVSLAGRVDQVSVGDAGLPVWTTLANPLIGAGTPPQGEGSTSFGLSARGATVGALIDNLDGWTALEVRDGSVSGVDLVSTLESLANGRGPFEEGKAFMPTAGRTSFSRFTANFTAEAGVVRADRVRIAGDRYQVLLSGTVDLKHGEIDAAGAAQLYPVGSNGGSNRLRPSVELPFGVGGTLRDPMVAPGVPAVQSRLEGDAVRPWDERRHAARQGPGFREPGIFGTGRQHSGRG